MDKNNLYWLVGLVLFLAVMGGYLVWKLHAPAATPVTPITLPTAGTPNSKATYYCDNSATMQAVFKTDKLDLTLSDGRTFSLPQAVSGSGIRYEATTTRYGTDVAFVGKGDNAFLTENSNTTYANCTAATVESSDAPGYETYTDAQKSFTFAFPTNLTVTGTAIGLSEDWSALAAAPGMRLAHLTAPATLLPGTNFDDASFSVGSSVDPAAVAGCFKDPAGKVGTTTVKLGLITFTKLTYSDAAAGNRYDTTSYRIVRDSACWAIEYTIHYGAIANYPKGSVKEFDEAGVTATLDEVARTFQFLR